MSLVSFANSTNAWTGFYDKVELIIQQGKYRNIFEIGGGANPTLSIDRITELGLTYTLLDISESELKKAPLGYLTVQSDICAKSIALRDECDFAFSKMLAEHLPSGETFHRNIFNLLKPGGIAFHFFPTLYAMPFAVNRLMPEKLSEALLHFIQPGREQSGSLGKFPAYYSWCRGPTRRQISRLQSIGFEVIEFKGFFGHADYYAKIPWLKRSSEWISVQLLKHRIATLTSYAYLVLQKPL